MLIMLKKYLFSLMMIIVITYPSYSATCFYQYEQISGLNKICFYDCLGSARALTIKNYQLCPLSIQG